MANTIYKYKLNQDFIHQRKELPQDAVILSATMQDNEIFIYAHVNNSYPTEERDFLVIPTGFNTDEILGFEQYGFLDTVALYDSRIMLHIYYKPGRIKDAVQALIDEVKKSGNKITVDNLFNN